jgi:hypothetical protein
MTQLDMFTNEVFVPKTGAQNRDEGIKKAVDHAENNTPGWSITAYQFALSWLSNRSTPFLGEDIRNASLGFVPDPPSKRAWGGILKSLAKNKMIVRIGYGQVKNPNANCANASLWTRN